MFTKKMCTKNLSSKKQEKKFSPNIYKRKKFFAPNFLKLNFSVKNISGWKKYPSKKYLRQKIFSLSNYPKRNIPGKKIIKKFPMYL